MKGLLRDPYISNWKEAFVLVYHTLYPGGETIAAGA